MIPNNRRVRGGDVVPMEHFLQLRPPDMQWLLGTNTHAYYALRRAKGGDVEPLRARDKKPGMTQAMILRFLEKNEHCLPIIRPPRVGELFDLCKKIDPGFTPRHLGVLLGRDGAAGYRWVHKDSGKAMRQEVYRWMTIVWLALKQHENSPARQKQRLVELFDMVIIEATMRGFDPGVLRERFMFVEAGSPRAVPRRTKGGPGRKPQGSLLRDPQSAAPRAKSTPKR